MSDSTPNSRAIDLSFLKKQEEKTILRDNYLFVIGINEYQHCTPLGNAVNDAQSFASVLNEKYRFKKEHTFSLINQEATISNIDDTFKAIKGKVRSETDNLIVFFCGHGYYDKEWDTAYWVPVEAKADRALGEYFSHEDLMKRINAIKTHHTVVIADSCYSGAAFVSQKRSHDPNSEIFAKEPSRWMLASGRNEPVNDGKINQNSPFTGELLDILEGESNTGIRMGTLVERLKTRVNNNYDQTPIGQPLKDVGDKGGEFIFFPQDKEEDKWREAKVKNTLEAYEFFLTEFKDGNFSPEAKTRIMEIRAENLFNQIQATPAIELCQSYLDKYPKGKDLHKVTELKYELGEDRFWNHTLKENTLTGYEAYLDNYPNGRYLDEAREGRDKQKNGLKAWKEADALYTIASFESFIQQYKDSEYFDDATAKLKELKDWKHAQASKNAEMLASFIKTYPDSQHLGKAQELLRNTAENKLKRKKQMVIAAVSTIAIVLTIIIISNSRAAKKDKLKHQEWEAVRLIKNQDFKGALKILVTLEEEKWKLNWIQSLKNLSVLSDSISSQEMIGFQKVDSFLWAAAENHFLIVQNTLENGLSILTKTKDDSLKSIFSPRFNAEKIDSIRSRLVKIRDNLDHFKVSEKVKRILDLGDSFIQKSDYEQAYSIYDSAKNADTYKENSEIAQRLRIAQLGKENKLPSMVGVEEGQYKLRAASLGSELVKAFHIGKYEVTNLEYVLFLNENISNPDISKWINLSYGDIGKRSNSYYVKGSYQKYPVVGVSWEGANAYASWALASLPTEMQWEFAASSGGDEIYDFSGGNSRSFASYYRSRRPRAFKATNRPKNSLGIHGMSGNVWEWCADGQGSLKTVKGGSFNRSEEFSKIESRHFHDPKLFGGPKRDGTISENDMGFRIIRRKK